jgi:hypothetical protein
MDETLLSTENEANLTKTTDTSIIDANEQSKGIDQKDHIINAICQNLKDIIKDNSSFISYVSKDKFYLSQIPNISLNDYLKRLVKYNNMDISTLINAIIYIDIFCEKNKYILCMNNIYLILLSSCLLSIKFNEDVAVNLMTYSKIAGVSLDKIINLENSLYFNLHFGLFVKEDLYQNYFNYFSNFECQNSKKGKEV